MNEREQQLAKSFVDQEELYTFVKTRVLNFGKMDTDGLSDLEVGARYKVRESELKRIRKIFKSFEFLN